MTKPMNYVPLLGEGTCMLCDAPGPTFTILAFSSARLDINRFRTWYRGNSGILSAWRGWALVMDNGHWG